MSNPAPGMPYSSTPDIPPAQRDLGRGGSLAPVSSAPSAWLVNLRQRVVTAVVLIPVVLAVVWLGGWAAFAAAAVVVVVGTWELRALCARRGWHPLVVLSGALSLDFLLAAMLPTTRGFLVEIGISVCVVASFVWLMVTRPATDRTLIDWTLTLAIPFYLGWPLAFLLLLRGAQVGWQARGFWWVLLLLLSVWANDSAALVTGHTFGRHRLAPRLSPNKTWEGTIGGLLGAVGAVVVVNAIADQLLPHSLRALQLPWYQLLLLGGLVALAATLGDLAKSLLKRGTGVKESGAIFPGHGGMLDRVDSLLFAAYVVYFYALSLGALH
jgi:phosphatidate cytidylyltransferase